MLRGHQQTFRDLELRGGGCDGVKFGNPIFLFFFIFLDDFLFRFSRHSKPPVTMATLERPREGRRQKNKKKNKKGKARVEADLSESVRPQADIPFFFFFFFFFFRQFAAAHL